MKFIINKDIKNTLKEVKDKIEEENGLFDWNIESWEFSIKWVKWEYFIDNNEITINIIDKPFLVSLWFIENKLEEYFK